MVFEKLLVDGIYGICEEFGFKQYQGYFIYSNKEKVDECRFRLRGLGRIGYKKMRRVFYLGMFYRLKRKGSFQCF